MLLPQIYDKNNLFVYMAKVHGSGDSDPGSIPWSDFFNVI